MSTTPTPVRWQDQIAATTTGQVGAPAANGYVSLRGGKFGSRQADLLPGTGFAVTCIIPGKGDQRPVGAVIANYATYDAAVNAAADAVALNVGWRDARVVLAVNAIAAPKDASGQPVKVDGKVVTSRQVTGYALWLYAVDVAAWLAAETAAKLASQPPAADPSKPGPKPGPRTRNQRTA